MIKINNGHWRRKIFSRWSSSRWNVADLSWSRFSDKFNNKSILISAYSFNFRWHTNIDKTMELSMATHRRGVYDNLIWVWSSPLTHDGWLLQWTIIIASMRSALAEKQKWKQFFFFECNRSKNQFDRRPFAFSRPTMTSSYKISHQRFDRFSDADTEMIWENSSSNPESFLWFGIGRCKRGRDPIEIR